MMNQHYPDKEQLQAMVAKLKDSTWQQRLQYLQSMGWVKPKPEPALLKEGHAQVCDPSKLRPISIWEPKNRDGVWTFERPMPGPFDDHYSKQRRFAHSKPAGVKRIAYFGESAAAGYLLAPYLTPAGALQKRMDSAFPDARFEVLDFSRTNENLEGMIQTAKAAMQLSPDALVFFAGNNWPLMEVADVSPFRPSGQTQELLYQSWCDGGLAQVKVSEQRLLLSRVGGQLEAFGEYLKARELPVIWMIPEVNLVDWDHGQPPPPLVGQNLATWYQVKHDALQLLADEEFADVEVMAWQLLELDQGACPVGYRLLGLAYLGMEKHEAARLAFEYEIQSAGYVGTSFLGAPQVTPQLRRLLTKFTARFGFYSVDLKDLFAGERPGSLPDKYFFLDYCHLTKEGVAVAVKALAEKLGKALGLGPTKQLDADHGCWMSSNAEALAYLGAAIHSCHRQVPTVNSEATWRYWIEKALATDPTAIDLVSIYIQQRLSIAPEVFTKAQQENFSQACPLTPQHGWFYDFFDGPMIALMLEALEAHAPTRFQALQAEVLTHGAVGESWQDLTRAGEFLWCPLARPMPDVMQPLTMDGFAHFRCLLQEFQLAFVSTGKEDALLQIIARLPDQGATSAPCKLSVSVNHVPLNAMPVSKSWQRQSIRIPKSQLKKGVNQLSLEWPIPDMDGFHGRVGKHLADGRQTCFHPEYGQIFEIKIKANP